ncbi:BTB/POZ domain-containing protein KCTD14 isoform X1 [Rhinopithecus roxellana]|uniref:Potassium channel tetramerization domain containing 14 n=3 Tax=Colobinae TaxID=9569 RepID=A0A2K6MRI7_RHIBE|nr:BTB/POZ domain-containing protein KCTD14 isoform X1 [Rhinopithecus roxellana]XP_017749054.1 PREDICTED: BTB/POZ domain-containing protein KCTD14 [Rhinopithecus bieti]XP_033060259.1 BTB/POZ domain-containing protein KCTD14 [Trachypithecus francoisi]
MWQGCAVERPEGRMTSQTPLPQSPRPGRLTMSTVVELNVGGEFHTTTLGTLRKFPGSKLAEMFSSSAKASMDAEGRFFIDRPSTYFRPILDYLRTGQVPTQHIPEVYREAQFYEIKPLVKLLEDMPQIFGEQVSRKQFLLQVPGYGENLELMVRLARAEGITARKSSVLVCLVETEEQDAYYSEVLCFLQDKKMFKSVVKFGPWKAVLDNSDLMHCLEMDIKAQGYKVFSKFYLTYPTKRNEFHFNIYSFTFTWW